MRWIAAMTTRWLLGATLFAALIGLTGCGESTESSSPAPPVPKVALIMKSLANEFFVSMQQAAQAHQRDHAQQYELIVNGIKSESDLAQQVALVDQMIARGVDAIVITPADSRALVPALARAVAAGIPVVNIDNRLDAEVMAEFDLTIPYIGPSNRDGARLVAEYVLARHEAGSGVFVLEGMPTAFNGQQRRLGFQDAIDAAGMTVLASQSAAWDQTRAAEITAAVLNRHPDIAVILAANDNMALGAANAVGLAGRDDIEIGGFDNIQAVRPLLQNGRIVATVDQFGDQFAIYGIEFALEMIAGTAEMIDRTTPVELVTPEDVTP